jgi:hypothetical protein
MGKDIPTALFRFRKPQGMLVYCISLTGQPMQIQVEPLQSNDTAFTAYRIIIQPVNKEGPPISVIVHPNSKEGKFFVVEGQQK